MLNEVKGELIPTGSDLPGIRVLRPGSPLSSMRQPGRSTSCRLRGARGDLPLHADHRQRTTGRTAEPERRLRTRWQADRSGMSASRVNDGRLLALLSSMVGDDVDRLELTIEGRTTSVPLQGRFFLLELSGGGARPTPDLPEIQLVAYDGTGQELARQRSRPPFGGRGERPQPLDLRGQTPLIEIKTRHTGKPIQLYVFELVRARSSSACVTRASELCSAPMNPGKPNAPTFPNVRVDRIGVARGIRQGRGRRGGKGRPHRVAAPVCRYPITAVSASQRSALGPTEERTSTFPDEKTTTSRPESTYARPPPLS